MTRKALTIFCRVCKIEITGALDERGWLYADNRRRTEHPPQPGWCMQHLPKSDR